LPFIIAAFPPPSFSAVYDYDFAFRFSRLCSLLDFVVFFVVFPGTRVVQAWEGLGDLLANGADDPRPVRRDPRVLQEVPEPVYFFTVRYSARR